MSEINPELRERLKSPTEQFINYVKSQENGKVPTSDVYKPETDGGISKERVSDFANIANDYTDDELGIFKDVCEWVVSSGIGYKDQKKYESSDRLIEGYTKDFVYFSANVMNYTGSFSFEEKGYNEAFDKKIGREYGEACTYKRIRPIKGARFEEEFKLSTDIDIKTKNNSTTVVSIEIAPITLEEKCAVLSFAKPSALGIGNSGYLRPGTTYVVRTEFEGDWLSSIGGDISEMVITALKLFNPKMQIGKGDVFDITPNGISYRENVERVTSIHQGGDSISVFENSLVKEVEEFKGFWERYGSYCHTGKPLSQYEVKSAKISRPLRRFKQMYTKERSEDAIIDSIIGFEGTLKKNGGSLPARGVVLLKDYGDPEFIYAFLDELWNLRNRIVHNDAEVGELEIQSGELHTQEIVTNARRLLAKTILEYIDLMESEDKNITQINNQIIRKEVANRLDGSSRN